MTKGSKVKSVELLACDAGWRNYHFVKLTTDDAVDRLAWDHELFTHLPDIQDGHLIIPDRPGWGTEPNEEGLRAHPPKNTGGLLNYGRNAP